MVEKDAVSKDFRKQVLGYGLTTAEIVYRRPDRHWLLQTYVWQDYDMFPNFPALQDFLAAGRQKMRNCDLAELARVKIANLPKAICAQATEFSPKLSTLALMQSKDSVHGA